MTHGLRTFLHAFIVALSLGATSPPAAAQTISQTVGTDLLSSSHSLGQSFTATTTGWVTAIDVRSLQEGAVPLYFYNGASGSGISTSVGRPAYTQAGVYLREAGAGYVLTLIPLTTPFPVVAGSSYTFTMTNPLLLGTFVDVYPGGTMVHAYGNIQATTDIAFQVYEASAQADVSITQTDGVATVAAGGITTYAITASNAGPAAVAGARVLDFFPADLTATWTCVGAGGGTCTAAGSGNIDDTVSLPVGGSVTYTVNAAISPTASGTIANTATITALTAADFNPANNSATDTDAIQSADLSITKTDGVTTAIPGMGVTYTITASNAGPSDVASATVADTFPAILTANWTCVGAGGGICTASGAGNINDTVALPAGGSVTYTVNAAISAGATGTLSNTATVASAVTDPDPGNNSATDTDTLAPQADLAITKTDGVTIATPGGSVTYTITASNAGPSNATGATVADTLPASLTGTWTCVGAGGGTCTASGTGNINDTVNLPAGGSVTYTVSATISGAATGTLVNTATVAAAGGVTDPTPGNNSATDTDTLTLVSFSGPSATGSGTITAGFAPNGGCTFSAPQFIGAPPGAPPIPPTAPPGSIVFPHGLFDFSVTGCTAGASLTFTITYPRALPGGTQYWKYGPEPANATPHWYVMPATIAGNTATFTITDGGQGDDDLAANGTIVDQGGPGFGGVNQVPTISQWMLAMMALLMLVAAVAGAVRRRPR